MPRPLLGRPAQVTKSEARLSLEALVKSHKYQWRGAGQQAVVTAVLDSVICIIEERSPRATKIDDPLWHKARSALARWCVIDVGLQPAAEAGGSSARAAFSEYEKRKGDKPEVTCAELRGLSTFAWLLTDVRRRTLVKWTDSAAAAAVPVPSAGGGGRGAEGR